MTRLLLTFLGFLTVPSQAVSAQRTGLVVVAHGADSGWNARVRATVAQVQWRGPVAVAFLMGEEANEASFGAAVRAAVAGGAERLVVVPLMVSSHGAHTRQVEHYAGLRPDLPAELHGHAHAHGAMVLPSVPVRVTAAIDAAPELGRILHDRWSTRDERERRAPVLLVAHGPSTDADALAWEEALRVATAPLAIALDDTPLRIGLLRDDAPAPVRARAVAALRDTVTALAARSADSVLVMTVLVSSGSIDRVRIPQDLAGLPIHYAGMSLAPHPALARWIERVAGAAW